METGAGGGRGGSSSEASLPSQLSLAAPGVISHHLTQRKCSASKSWDSQVLQIPLSSLVSCPSWSGTLLANAEQSPVTSWCPPYSWPATPQSFLTQPRSFSLLGTQVSCPLHLGKSESENGSGRRGPSALLGWAWAAAAPVPLSSSPKALPQHKVSSGRGVRLLRKGTQSSPPPRSCGLFSRLCRGRALGAGRDILGMSGGGASKGHKPSCWGFLFSGHMIWVLSLPLSRSVSSFDN